MKSQLNITVEGKGKDVVLLHGWAMHSGIYKDLVKLLSKDYRVHSVDLPGHGKSQAQGGFTLDSVCEQLHEQLPVSATWIGWSLGGMIALQMADTYTEQVEQLILFATNPAFVKRADWLHGVEISVLENFARELAENYQRTLRRFYALQVRGAENASQTLKQLNNELLRFGEPDVKDLGSGLDILKHADLRQALRSLNCPVAMIFGQRDTLVPVGVIDDIKNIKSGCHCASIKSAGHIPFVSHASECDELIVNLLAERSAIKRAGQCNEREVCG
jgi:pimeloyl-[acyl-carrier protein] methyl ester esterase